ncbi:riboflavin synthase [Calycomorphotria hydatis]|uniref:Riboflavin synthase n=1 Tax=Calycomorphotria hydatis TaxID=2528027 RepID=A0A517T634_9PLAN|nr:riboflavin synthase [Calycomorphotria hydatis]QDT63820.1 Riboflavin synthase [Calycomorphotria hydatis]
MFTGLIEGVGIVRELAPREDDLLLKVEFPESMTDDLVLGASVAFNGCCLTLVSIDGTMCAVEAGAETLAKTNLGKLDVGSRVNLERALKADARLGGHFVQGHIDGTAAISAIDQHGEWADMRFTLSEELAQQLVPKGSIAIDGISLTVVDAAQDSFSVALIPHTLQETTLSDRQSGDTVNIETDILGKYVRKFLPQ